MIPPGIELCDACGRTWYAGRCYRQCAECGHVYRRTFPGEYSLPRVVWETWRRPSKVYFCQCCIHDF
jgi:hypothetical protein